MKKIFFLILALSTIITFASCEDKETSKEEISSKETETSVEISADEVSEEAEEYGEYGKKISKFFSNMFEKALVAEEKVIFGMCSEGTGVSIYREWEGESDYIYRVEATYYNDSNKCLELYANLDEETVYYIFVRINYNISWDESTEEIITDAKGEEKEIEHYIIKNKTTVYEYDVETGNIGNVVEDKGDILETYDTLLKTKDRDNVRVGSSAESIE